VKLRRQWTNAVQDYIIASCFSNYGPRSDLVNLPSAIIPAGVCSPVTICFGPLEKAFAFRAQLSVKEPSYVVGSSFLKYCNTIHILKLSQHTTAFPTSANFFSTSLPTPILTLSGLRAISLSQWHQLATTRCRRCKTWSTSWSRG